MAKEVGIDVGHGSNTFLEKHSKGVYTKLAKEGRLEEHWFNAAVSEYAKKILVSNGIDVAYGQQPNKTDVPLTTRTNFYNNNKVQLVVSNHANAGVSKANGFSVFYWHTSKESKKLAELFLKYAKEANMNIFGTGVIASVPHTWTDFHMCRETDMPSVLVEWAFMTNEDDLKRLLDDSFRKKCAEIEAKAIMEYLGVKPVVRESADVKKPEPVKQPEKKVETKPVSSPIPKPTPSPSMKLVYTRLLKKGMKGNDVKALQVELNKLNFKCGSPDGDFGKKTQDAVERFQKVYLPKEVDSICGKNVISQINKLIK